jgi:hypothetical protein
VVEGGRWRVVAERILPYKMEIEKVKSPTVTGRFLGMANGGRIQHSRIVRLVTKNEFVL